MNRSSRIAVGSLGLGTVVSMLTGVFVFPNMPWFTYLGITVIVAAIVYPQWLQMAANEQIIDNAVGPKTKKE